MKAPLYSVALALSVSAVSGQGLLVDQQWTAANDVFVPFGTSTEYSDLSASVGQEFTPSLKSLNAAEFAIGEGLGTVATLYLQVRSGSITGPVIATSNPRLFPPRSTGTAKFEFSSLVPLTPGIKYVLELQTSSPVIALFVLGSATDGFYHSGNYPGGELIIGTRRVPDSDLLFREGIVLDRAAWLNETIIPEPTPMVLALAAGGILAGAAIARTVAPMRI